MARGQSMAKSVGDRPPKERLQERVWTFGTSDRAILSFRRRGGEGPVTYAPGTLLLVVAILALLFFLFFGFVLFGVP